MNYKTAMIEVLLGKALAKTIPLLNYFSSRKAAPNQNSLHRL